MPGTPATSPNFGVPRYSASDTADFATQVNALTDAFDAAAAKRGVIVDADISPTAAIAKSKLAAGVGADVGDVKMTALATAPAGWLLCDGSPISRATYNALWLAIGTTYGSGLGDGLTFNVPNLQARVPIGASSSYPRGAAGGEAAHALSNGEMPNHGHGGSTNWMDRNNVHNHTVNDPSHYHLPRSDVPYGNDTSQPLLGTWIHPTPTATGAWYTTTGVNQFVVAVHQTANATTGITLGDTDTNHQHAITPDGGGGAHNNLQPYLALNYVIKF